MGGAAQAAAHRGPALPLLDARRTSAFSTAGRTPRTPSAPRADGGARRSAATMAPMDAAETRSNLGPARRSHDASARPPLPLWVPPVCAVMFGAAVALQTPRDGMPGLTAPLVGLVLALGAYALVTGVRARQGTPKRRVSPAALAATATGVTAFSTSSSTAPARPTCAGSISPRVSSSPGSSGTAFRGTRLAAPVVDGAPARGTRRLETSGQSGPGRAREPVTDP